MIDHVSLAVPDLAASTAFYDDLLATLDLKRLVTRDGTVGYGKRYPEFWLNARPEMAPVPDDSGVHVCLRGRSRAVIEAFHAAALAGGGGDDGAPGLRPEYSPGYFAAFVRDPDGNRIEAVTFLKDA